MRTSFYKGALWTAFILYMAVLVKLIFLKTQLGTVNYHYLEYYHGISVRENLFFANLIPFKGIIGVMSANTEPAFIIQNLGGNIIGFMPLGFLVPMLFPYAWSLKRIILTGFLTSLTFETIQLVGTFGCFDVDDMILNTVGTILGFLCLVFVSGLLYPRFRRGKSSKSINGVS